VCVCVDMFACSRTGMWPTAETSQPPIGKAESVPWLPSIQQLQKLVPQPVCGAIVNAKCGQGYEVRIGRQTQIQIRMPNWMLRASSSPPKGLSPFACRWTARKEYPPRQDTPLFHHGATARVVYVCAMSVWRDKCI